MTLIKRINDLLNRINDLEYQLERISPDLIKESDLIEIKELKNELNNLKQGVNQCYN